MSSDANIVKYGDVVLLNDFVSKGFLTARRQKLCQMMIEVNDFDRSAVGAPSYDDNPHPRPPESADCCFRVVPKLAYSKLNAFTKSVRGIKDPMAPEVVLSPNQQAALLKMQEEAVENARLQAKMRGSPVIYGSTIQLYHERTGTYVTLLKERADMDTSKLKVALDDEGNKNSWFQFNPGYKTGKMGETVQYPSVCCLTSTKNDVNIHVSSSSEASTGIKPAHFFVTSVLEVNAFVQGTVFRVLPYRLNRDPEIRELEMSSGESFTLYHAETDGFLVCENGRCFFKRKNEDTDRSLDSSALWTCEGSSAMYGGEHLNSTMVYRLQHVISGQCLFGGQKDGEGVETSQDYLQAAAEWTTKPFGAMRKQIFVGGQIQLVSSKGNYVCAAKEFAPGKYEVITSTVSSDRDALVISRPDPLQMQVLNKTKETKRRLEESRDRMISTFESCGSHAKAVQNEVPTLMALYSTMTLNCTLGPGNDPFTKIGDPSVAWQDIFGEQEMMEVTISVITTIFDTLQVPMEDIEGDKCGKQAVRCIMLMFRFIRMLVMRNPVNQSKLAQHIDFLNRFLPFKFQVVDTLAELFTGNLKVLTAITDKDLEDLLVILKDKHEKTSAAARFVDLLRNICGCNGVPIPENQNRVVDKFVQDETLQLRLEYRDPASVHSPGASLLPKSASRRQKKEKSASSSSSTGTMPFICDVIHGGEWIPLSNFCGKTTQILAKPINSCTLEEKVYRYHIQTMRLFVALCAGRNRLATDYLLSKAHDFGLAYQDLMNVLRNDIIPPAYRAIIAEVIVALYIDREPNETISPIQRIHIWSSVSPTSAPERQKVDPFKNFPDLRPPPGFTDFKAYLLTFLSQTASFDVADINKSTLQGCMILMAKLLLEFGFYHNPDSTADLAQCSTLIDPLLQLLDGRADGTYPERCQESQENVPVFTSKLNICKILEFVFDCRQDKRLRIAFKLYENAMNTALKAGSYNGPEGKSPWNEATLEQLNEQLFKTPLISKKVAMSSDIHSPPTFVLVLLDCMRYQSPSLVVTATSLLNRHFGQRSAMIKTMQRLQIVVFPEVAELVGEVRIHVSEMRRNRKWLKSPDDVARQDAMSAVHRILDRWLNLLQLHNSVEIGAKTITVGAAEVVKFQEMLMNLGAFEKVMDVLKIPIPSAGSEMGKEMYPIYNKLYEFLCLFCEKNTFNQQAVYAEQAHFFVHMADEILAVAAGKLMATAVENNKVLLESLTDKLLTRIFKFLAERRVPTWLDFLTNLCKLNGQRHSRNSAQVMKRLSANPDLLTLYPGPDGVKQLLHALATDLKAIDWHLASMRILSTCCMDKSPDNEVKAQSSASWSDVLTKLLCLEEGTDVTAENPLDQVVRTAAVLEVKTVYFDFIRNVYMNSETEVAKLVFSEKGSRVWPDEEPIGTQLELKRDAPPLPVTWIANHNILLQRWFKVVLAKSAGASLTWNRSKNPRTLMHECVAGLQRLWLIAQQIDGSAKRKGAKKQQSAADVLDMLNDVVPVDITEARQFMKHVMDGVIPVVQAYYQTHFHTESSSHLQQRITSTIMGLVGHVLSFSLLEATHIKKLESLVVVLEGHGFVFEGEEMSIQEETRPSNNALFKAGFQHFVVDVAKKLGINDLKRTLGQGIKNLARMMCLTNVPETTPVQTYREVIFGIFEVLLARPRELTNALLVDMLRMTRAVVYMEDPRDPDGLNQDSSWDDFVKDLPPKKSQPQRQMVEWVQTKVSSLGGIVAAGRFVYHADETVSIAALRLGITLLEHGNRTAQECLLKNLIQTQNDDFFWAFTDYINKACVAIKEWRVHLKKRALAQQLATRRSSHQVSQTHNGKGNGAPDSVEEATASILRDVSLALRFLQLCMEGHYLDFQNLLREQISNRISYNLLNSAADLLAVLDASLQFCFDNQYGTILPLLIQLCEFMTESMQGSCFPNQVDLSSNQAAMLYDRVLKTTSFSQSCEYDDAIIQDGPRGAPVSIRSAKCTVRHAMVTTIISILEDNYDSKLGQRILSNIDADSCARLIISVFDGFLDIEGKLIEGVPTVIEMMDMCDTCDADCTQEEVTTHALQTFCMLKYLEDRETPELGQVHTALKRMKGNPESDTRCRKWATSIEVARHHWTAAPTADPTTMMRIHFKVPEFCYQIQTRGVFKKHCEEVMFDIPRDNPVEKVLCLLQKLNTLVHEMDHMHSLVSNEHSTWLDTKMIVEYCDWIQDKPFVLALMTILTLTLFYGEHDDPYEAAPGMQYIVYLLCLAQFCVATAWAVTFYLVRAPIVCKVASGSSVAKVSTPKKPVHDPLLKVYEQPLAAIPSPPRVKTQEEWNREQLAFCWASRYYMVFVFISFLSVCGGPINGRSYPNLQFLMFFWVLDYFRLPAGSVIAMAADQAGPTLLKIWFGALLLSIMWTAVSFWLFQPDVNAFTGDKQCNTAYQCMLWGIHNGMRGDLKSSWGPIPTSSQSVHQNAFPLRIDDKNSLAFQWLVVLVYRMIWRFLFVGILTATIVGAFSGVQNRAKAKSNDAKERCIVCSLSRFTLEQEGGGFSEHVIHHHNPWSYLAFLAALKLGNEDNFTGLESNVFAKANVGDHTFLPVTFCAEIQALQRRKASEKARAMAEAEKDADGTSDFQKKIVKALDDISTGTQKLGIDLPSDFNQRLGALEAAMAKVTATVKALAN